MKTISGKTQFISAAILLGLLIPLFAIPESGSAKSPSLVGQTGVDQKSPSSAAFDLDSDYFHQNLDPVLYRLYNFSRDTNTEFGLEDMYFHLLSTNWSSFIGANDKYSLDNILTYFGIWPLKLGELGAAAMSLFNLTIVDSPLYTSFNSSSCAFRASMNQNGTALNNSYLMVDNAFALYSMLRYAGTVTIQPADALAVNLWNYLNNTLWHPDATLANNYFRPQNGTDPTETLTFFNLLGAFVGSMVARNGEVALDGVRSQAIKIAQQAFAAVNRTGVYENFGAYSNSLNFREGPADFHGISTLKTNALGIATLADFYIRSGRNNATNGSALAQAEDLYRVICERFFNNSIGLHGAFMDDLTGEGTGRSIQTSVEGNAYWLIALARLFEATGNITYYVKGIEVYNQVVENLWDDDNFGFNRSMGFFGNDPTKSVGDNALFYFALQELDQAYWETTLFITQPPPDCVIHTNPAPVLNLTCQYNVTWVRDYSDTIGINYTINQAISAANVSFSLRYYNGTFITQLQNYTNVNGTFNLIYQLPDDLPLGTYLIHAYANRSGFGTAYAVQEFSIISNISVSALDPAITVIQGATTAFNITFRSTRNNASWVIFNGTGVGINTTAQTFLLVNNTTTERTMNFTADLDARIGYHNFNLTLTNDSITLLEIMIQIEVVPAVKLDVIEYAQKIVVDIDGVVFVVLENVRPDAQEAVNLTLRGSDLQAVTQLITLQAHERLRIYVPLKFTGTFNMGSVDFEINVSRYSQILSSNSYTSELVPAIKIAAISTSASVVQGREFYINFQAINNVNVTQTIQLYINGQLQPDSITLQPGINNKIIPRSPLTFNPWDFTTYVIDVTLKSGTVILYQDRLTIQAIVSVENVLFFYILPIVLPIAVVLIFFQRQKRRELLR